MKEPMIKKFKYHNDTDEYYVDILMKFWNLYRNDYDCKFMNHYAWKCIRDITTLKAQQSNTIWSKKARIDGKGDEHHLTPVKNALMFGENI